MNPQTSSKASILFGKVVPLVSLSLSVMFGGIAEGGAPGGSSSKSLDPSLVSLWKGDGNAQDSVGANNGTLIGGASFGPGVSGQGFVLDGVNDFVRIPDHPSLHLANELSVEMWFKREDSSS